MTEPVRVAVVGSGYFGRFHANHYSRNPRAKLVAVVDSDKERASAVAEEFGGEGVADHRSIVGRVDAVSVAVPTPLHFFARDLIQAGIRTAGLLAVGQRLFHQNVRPLLCPPANQLPPW